MQICGANVRPCVQGKMRKVNVHREAIRKLLHTGRSFQAYPLICITFDRSAAVITGAKGGRCEGAKAVCRGLRKK